MEKVKIFGQVPIDFSSCHCMGTDISCLVLQAFVIAFIPLTFMINRQLSPCVGQTQTWT